MDLARAIGGEWLLKVAKDVVSWTHLDEAAVTTARYLSHE